MLLDVFNRFLSKQEIAILDATVIVRNSKHFLQTANYLADTEKYCNDSKLTTEYSAGSVFV